MVSFCLLTSLEYINGYDLMGHVFQQFSSDLWTNSSVT
uniref:Uncharacterized protein n=1 Tax=Triticum urartu TaxID=4572 RepID=A0A8R7URB0_TRIUA